MLEKILVCRGRGRNDLCSARFCNLDRETTDAARAAVNENGLSRLQFRHVYERLPRSQGTHGYRRCFHEVERLGLYCNFPLLDGDVISPAAAESWVTVNRVAHFEFRHVCSRFLYDSGDFVTRN